MLIGYRFNKSGDYTTGYYTSKWSNAENPQANWVDDICTIVPAGEKVTVEVLTICCVGKLGPQYQAEIY